jgi:ribosome-associated protein
MAQDTDVSKSQRKREMHALQSLGENLVRLPSEQLARLDLPEILHEAIMQARSISQRGALRRQLQYVGRLMRDVDADRIRDQLQSAQTGSARDVAILHRAERWRERLLAEDAALSEFVSAFTAIDVQRLHTLLRNARRDRAAGRPLRAYRELFRFIRDILMIDEDATRPGSPG